MLPFDKSRDGNGLLTYLSTYNTSFGFRCHGQGNPPGSWLQALHARSSASQTRPPGLYANKSLESQVALYEQFR